MTCDSLLSQLLLAQLPLTQLLGALEGGLLARTAFSHNLPPMASPRDQASEFLQESLGKKVSIRLHDEDGGFRDLLGELIATDTVRRKDGTMVTFDRDKVFAFRIVTPPAGSRGPR